MGNFMDHLANQKLLIFYLDMRAGFRNAGALGI